MSLLQFSGCATNEEKPLVGGYAETSLSATETTSAAEFAVAEQSKKGTSLKLSSIQAAKSQVVAGTNLELTLIVNDNGVEKTALAVVYTDLSQTRSLTSWAWLPTKAK